MQNDLSVIRKHRTSVYNGLIIIMHFLYEIDCSKMHQHCDLYTLIGSLISSGFLWASWTANLDALGLSEGLYDIRWYYSHRLEYTT